jgi:hypothetical protein
VFTAAQADQIIAEQPVTVSRLYPAHPFSKTNHL